MLRAKNGKDILPYSHLQWFSGAYHNQIHYTTNVLCNDIVLFEDNVCIGMLQKASTDK